MLTGRFEPLMDADWRNWMIAVPGWPSAPDARATAAGSASVCWVDEPTETHHWRGLA